MRLLPSFLLSSSLLFIFLQHFPEPCQTYRVYPFKGIVYDIRLHPKKFLAGWFFKKGFILLKLHLKAKLIKKLLLKGLLRKLLLAKAFGTAKIALLGRKKRGLVSFPSNGNTHSNDYRRTNHNNDLLAQDEDISTLGFSQEELDRLRNLTPELRDEYHHEMEQTTQDFGGSTKEKMEEIRDYFETARDFDSASCIQRSICEIVNRNESYGGSGFEKQVMEYYSSPLVTSQYEDDHYQLVSPENIYASAALVGKQSVGDGGRRCGVEFSQCGDNKGLDSFINEVFTPEMCSSRSN